MKSYYLRVMCDGDVLHQEEIQGTPRAILDKATARWDGTSADEIRLYITGKLHLGPVGRMQLQAGVWIYESQ